MADGTSTMLTGEQLTAPIDFENMMINNATLFYTKNACTTMAEIKTVLSTLDDRLGLGKDSISFKASPKVVEYDYAGKLDRSCKEMEDITAWTVEVEGDVLDFKKTVLQVSLMEKVDSETDTDFEIYSPKSAFNNDYSDYVTLLVVGRVKSNDKPIILKVNNTYNSEGFNIKFKDKDNAVTGVKFSGKYSFKNPTQKPFEIIIPKKAS